MLRPQLSGNFSRSDKTQNRNDPHFGSCSSQWCSSISDLISDMYKLRSDLESQRLFHHLQVILPDSNVTCIVHDDCILPCSFRPTSTVVIHWYKQQIPVHSYYYNKDQFGLQNKHFSGRTCLFNSHIPHGNASLLLRRVKVQDKGRYKCYTSTRKVNQEIFINLEVKGQCNAAALQSIFKNLLTLNV